MSLCQCGCGSVAPIAKKSSSRWGHIKGQPMRFVLGHATGRPLAERFWEKVDKGSSPDACWLWTGATNEAGYGVISVGGRDGEMARAHRVAWELTNGPIPDELCALHSCDNPPCVRPTHLFLGTKADNAADMIAKGRHRPGGVLVAAR